MSHYNTIMYQLQMLIPRHEFENLVNRYKSGRYIKQFSCWNQLTTMLYAQISGKDSLRDIQNSLLAQQDKLYHLGLTKVRRSTLADANAQRDYQVYEQLYHALLKRCTDVTPKHKFRFKNKLTLIDSTVIELCLSSFNWARFRTTKGAIKLHCQLDLSGQLPSFVYITDGKIGDITAARSSLPIIPDSIYCMDRGYIDFAWLYSITTAGAFFVTRAKDNFNYTLTGQQAQNQKKGVISDQIVMVANDQKCQDYPQQLRLVRYYDQDTDQEFAFLTNNFTFAASTIAQIYKARWYIESFFKWMKQNLKIKTFLGTSPNAVFTQIWIAICYYLLLSYIKYQSKYKYSLFYLHKVIKEMLLERFSLIDLLNLNDRLLAKVKNMDQQLTMNFAYS